MARAIITMHPTGAYFSANHAESLKAAHLAARDYSKKHGRLVELRLQGTAGDGVVGQYLAGAVTAEFKGHDRSAGLRSKVAL